MKTNFIHFVVKISIIALFIGSICMSHCYGYQLNRITELEPTNNFIVLNKVTEMYDFQSAKKFQEGSGFRVIRSFKLNDIKMNLVVNIKTLKTYIVDSITLNQSHTVSPRSFEIDVGPIWTLVLNQNTNNLLPRFAITIDMCPSSVSKWENDELFEWLVNIAKKYKKPISIGIAITKKWIKAHEKEFNKLLEWQENKMLHITWINHSANHKLNEDRAGKLMFLTSTDTDIDSEVLEVETELLHRSQMPSIFFRFPGLVYDDAVLKNLKRLSLIAIDSDTWINKGQNIHDGSIVLLHGNGNEHSGIIKFKEQLYRIYHNDDAIVKNILDLRKEISTSCCKN